MRRFRVFRQLFRQSVIGFGAVLAIASWSCVVGCASSQRGVSVKPKIDLWGEASAATRLLLSTSETYAVAELHGGWVDAAFGWGERVPPVLKVLEVSPSRSAKTAKTVKMTKTIKTVNGWALGPPLDSGEQFFVGEKDKEQGYFVGTTQQEAFAKLTPPAGRWHVKAVDRVGESAVIVLYQPQEGSLHSKHLFQQLWVVSVSTADLTVQASRIVEGPITMAGGAKVGHALLANEKSGLCHLVFRQGADSANTWHVVALHASTLQTAWQTKWVQPKSTGSINGPFDVRMERTGDGSLLALIAGYVDNDGIDVAALAVFDTKTGIHQRDISMTRPDRSKHSVSFIGTVGQSFPATSASLALMYQATARKGGGSATDTKFEGIVLADLTTGKLKRAWENTSEYWGDRYKSMHGMVPRAAVMKRDGVIVFAPESYAWARSYGLKGDWPKGYEYGKSTVEEHIGRNAAEVRGLVATPQAWHQRPVTTGAE